MIRIYHDSVIKQTKWTFIFIKVVTAVMTGWTLIDVLFGLSGGHHWNDVVAGVVVLAAGAVVYLFCLGIFWFVGAAAGD